LAPKVVSIGQMTVRTFLILALLLSLAIPLRSQEELLRIEISPGKNVMIPGDENLLIFKITPQAGTRISTHPEFMIKFEESENFSFSKLFFMGSEFNLPTTQTTDGAFLDLGKKIEIPFKTVVGTLPGKYPVNGEVVFMAKSKDNWYIKKFQKFSLTLTVTKGGRTPAIRRP
jgi:hypothetical protein